MQELAKGARVNVRGTATVKTDPDFASMSVSVAYQAEHRNVAIETATGYADILRAALEGVEGLRSFTLSRVHVTKLYREVESKHTHVGYTATISGRAEVSTEHVSLVASIVLDRAASLGYISWELDKDNEVYRRSRIKAVECAHTAALDFAGAVDRELDALVSLSDAGLSTASSPDQEFARFGQLQASGATLGTAADVEVSLDPEPQEVSTTVEASYLLA